MGQSAGASHVGDYLAAHDAAPGVAAAMLVSGVHDVASYPASPTVQAYYGTDPIRLAQYSAIPGLTRVNIPLFLASADLEPRAFQEQVARLNAALCLAARCPPYLHMAGHNHFSTVFAGLGGSGTDRSAAVADQALSQVFAVISAGPAGLMAAETLAQAGRRVVIFDQMASPAREIPDRRPGGGLNLTHSEPPDRFLTRYGEAAETLRPAIEAFPPAALIAWAEGLGQEGLHWQFGPGLSARDEGFAAAARLARPSGWVGGHACVGGIAGWAGMRQGRCASPLRKARSALRRRQRSWRWVAPPWPRLGGWRLGRAAQ